MKADSGCLELLVFDLIDLFIISSIIVPKKISSCTHLIVFSLQLGWYLVEINVLFIFTEYQMKDVLSDLCSKKTTVLLMTQYTQYIGEGSDSGLMDHGSALAM